MEENITFRELIKKEEFSLLEIWYVFFNAIISIYKLFLFLFLFIIVISFLQYKYSPEEFEGKATVIIEQASTSSSMTGLNTLLGLSQNIPVSSSSGIMGPDMYQDIIQSQAFLSDVVSTKIPISINKDSLTLEEYYVNLEEYNFLQKLKNPNLFFKNKKEKKKEIDKVVIDKNALIQNQISPDLIFNSKTPPIVELNGTKAMAIGILKNKISIGFKDKYCTVIVKMPDPVLSSVVCNLVLEKLIDYISYYKTSKLRNNVTYLEERFLDAQQKYNLSLQKSASFKDNNFGMIFQSLQTKEQFLNNDVSITFNIYNQFAVQLEQAKIELKKETPLFSILEPITINWTRTAPYYKNILLKNMLFLFLFFIVITIFRIAYPKK